MAELIRKHGISRPTYFNWKAKYDGASVKELVRLKELEAEDGNNNDTTSAPREHGDQRCVIPKVVTPSAKRQAIAILHDTHGLSIGLACQVVRLSRTAYYQPPGDGDRLTRDQPVIDALQTLIAVNTRWGFWKCHDALRWAGHPWNHKRLHRVYCALRLNIPRRTRRRVPRRIQTPLQAAPRLNMMWAIDFMLDALYDGRRFRAFNVIDESNREGLAIEIGTTIPSLRVIAVLESCRGSWQAALDSPRQRPGADRRSR